MIAFPLPPDVGARILARAILRVQGGAGSGNFGHAGRPGVVGGSASDKASWYREGGDWNTGPNGERPYGWTIPENYAPPELHHTTKRDGGMWGSSHGNSQALTGEAAQRMGIAGYKHTELTPQSDKIVTNFLTEIANDGHGAEEVLYHAFENVKHTEFTPGDTLRLPLLAAAGEAGTTYGLRSTMEGQVGQPTVFVFEPGTQMVAYSRWGRDDAKEFGHVWSEAIVAGGYTVTKVEEHYFGSQHNNQHTQSQVFGKVVYLKQTETFDPTTKKWKPRG